MNWTQLMSTRRSRNLQGGRRSSPARGDPRAEFERDYGRAVYCTPVRRLQDKTQVFPLEPNDSVRTRLTHSLEVSSVARDIAFYALDALRRNGCSMPESTPIDASVVAATVGLIHDIGNPPFGHSGEEAMRTWYQRLFQQHPELIADLGGANSQFVQDFLCFEGNAQTIRLVGRLQILADYHGLNLTAATLSTACKYLAQSHQLDQKIPTRRHDHSKPGFFASEKRLVDLVREEVGTCEARHPLTFLVESADDSVFSVVDLEDGVKKGVLRWQTLRDELLDNLTGSSKEDAEKLTAAAEDYVGKANLQSDERERDTAVSQMFRTYVIGAHTAAAMDEFAAHYGEIMRGDYHQELLASGKTREILDGCKRIGVKRVYSADSILRLELYGRRVIHDLMNVLWEGAMEAPEVEGHFARKGYNLLSGNYKMIFEEERSRNELPETYLRLQLVGDYVAGMTDSFATSLHRQLFGG